MVIKLRGASMANSLVAFCTGEDMRVTRNILVAWGGPATHAVPARDAVAKRCGAGVVGALGQDVDVAALQALLVGLGKHSMDALLAAKAAGADPGRSHTCLLYTSDAADE